MAGWADGWGSGYNDYGFQKWLGCGAQALALIIIRIGRSALHNLIAAFDPILCWFQVPAVFAELIS